MNSPTQPASTPQPPSGGGGAVLVIVLGFLLIMVLGCGALCAGAFFVTKQAANWPGPSPIPLPGIAASPDVNDWITDRTLAPVYTTALDAVASNLQVIERLGDSIEPVQQDDTEALFRRLDSGSLKPGGETIEFDIKGSKGTGIVSVVATGVANGEFRVAKITVTFSDGATIDVPPPPDQPAFVPIR
jgi:hypothetical protein